MLKMKQAVQQYRGNYFHHQMSSSIPKPALETLKPESTSPKPISPKSSSPTSSIGSSICEVDRNKKSRRLQNTIDKIRSMVESPSPTTVRDHDHRLRLPSRKLTNRNHFRNHEDSSGHGSLNDTSCSSRSSSSSNDDEFEIIDVVNV